VISVVIPSFNRRESLLILLADIHAQIHVPFEVIVIDDASTDQTTEQVMSLFPMVRVILNTRNQGPAACRNSGIRSATGEIIVGFDSDVSIPDHSLFIKIVDLFNRRIRYGALAFRILGPDGKSDDTDRWWHPVPMKTYSRRAFVSSYFSGTAYAFQRHDLIRAGMFPELLYMHFEEVELAWRSVNAGTLIRYSPELTAWHHSGISSRRSEVDVFFRPRNQILIAASCLPKSFIFIYLGSRLAYQFYRSLKDGYLLDFINAMSSAVYLLPQQLSRRQPINMKNFRRFKLLFPPKTLKSRWIHKFSL
jgi:GT2 family glycosyltransferase